jgi:hypothetical protein
MARHEYVSYTLLNPVISSFNHNKLDYAQGSTPHDFSMSIAYEAVAYGNGTVTIGDPEGFGFEHYDQTPSSLQPGDGSRQASPSFIGGASTNTQEVVNTVSQQLNTYLNTKENQNSGSNKTLTTVQTQQTGGLQGFSFPQVNVNTQQNNTVVAKQINLNINNG